MSFVTKELAPKFFQADWIIELDGTTNSKRHTFQLDSTRGLYVLDFVCAANESGRYQESLNNSKIAFRIEKKNSKNSTPAQNRLAEDVDNGGGMLDYPVCVWATVGGEETRVLTLRQSNLWESELFHAKINNQSNQQYGYYQQSKRKLDVKVWIKFDDTKGAKLKALEDFLNCFKEQNRCDVHFSISSDQQIGAHLIVLCARSPVFKAMFQHATKESKTKIIELQDVERSILQDFLHYIYSGSTSNPLSEASAQPLYELANKYDIATLREECIIYMLLNIRIDNALNLLAWSHLYAIPRLRQAVIDFIALKGKEICNLAEWETFSKSYPDLCVEATRRIINQLTISNDARQGRRGNSKNYQPIDDFQ